MWWTRIPSLAASLYSGQAHAYVARDLKKHAFQRSAEGRLGALSPLPVCRTTKAECAVRVQTLQACNAPAPFVAARLHPNKQTPSLQLWPQLG